MYFSVGSDKKTFQTFHFLARDYECMPSANNFGGKNIQISIFSENMFCLIKYAKAKQTP